MASVKIIPYIDCIMAELISERIKTVTVTPPKVNDLDTHKQTQPSANIKMDLLFASCTM